MAVDDTLDITTDTFGRLIVHIINETVFVV